MFSQKYRLHTVCKPYGYKETETETGEKEKEKNRKMRLKTETVGFQKRVLCCSVGLGVQS